MNSGNVPGPNIVKNADYITLQIRDENGFLRKLEVPVDIVDDAPSSCNPIRVFVYDAPIVAGQAYTTENIFELLTTGDNPIYVGADGIDWDRSFVKTGDNSNNIGKLVKNDDGTYTYTIKNGFGEYSGIYSRTIAYVSMCIQF